MPTSKRHFRVYCKSDNWQYPNIFRKISQWETAMRQVAKSTYGNIGINIWRLHLKQGGRRSYLFTRTNTSLNFRGKAFSEWRMTVACVCHKRFCGVETNCGLLGETDWAWRTSKKPTICYNYWRCWVKHLYSVRLYAMCRFTFCLLIQGACTFVPGLTEPYSSNLMAWTKHCQRTEEPASLRKAEWPLPPIQGVNEAGCRLGLTLQALQ